MATGGSFRGHDHDLGRATESSAGRGRVPAVMDIAAHITGTIWKINVAVGDPVEEGDEVIVLEAMKMEMPLEAEVSGTVDKVTCAEGDAVGEGDTLLVLRDD